MAYRPLKNITRRDFVNGVSMSVLAAGTSGAVAACSGEPAGTPATGGSAAGGAGERLGVPYPPGKTGMRGSHEGSFEVAHDLAFGRQSWDAPDQQTDEDYDLIVVGGGISGLAAAYFYREQFGADKRILILDNHDDFGGHAKRNEFNVDGKLIYGYGGSQSIDTPSAYSDVSKALTQDIGIEVDRFYDYYDQSYFSDRNLVETTYFAKDHYGSDQLAPSLLPIFAEGPQGEEIRQIIATYPLSDEGRAALESLFLEEVDLLAGRSVEEKRNLMRAISYIEFLETYASMPQEVILYIRRVYAGLWGFAWDALSALEGLRLGMPGTYHLGITEEDSSAVGAEEPYIFHFPDGNASVARLLLRRLRPDVLAGQTMEDIVTARAEYSRLDEAGANIRVRLSATVVEARNTDEGGAVDVTYVKDGNAHRVRARHCVMACYNHMLRHICPQIPEPQKEALDYGEKTPIVYTNVALRNWRAFAEAGTFRIYSPQGFFHSITLDFPVSMGGYDYPSSPDEPIVATLNHVPITPGEGYGMKEQSRLGRQKLYQLSFADFEQHIVSQLTGALGPFGFDAERDIAAITVNRWPHGYAYEYHELEDDWSFGVDHGPHILGRTPIGNITIANSDSHANAYVDGAIDAAHRAIRELME